MHLQFIIIPMFIMGVTKSLFGGFGTKNLRGLDFDNI